MEGPKKKKNKGSESFANCGFPLTAEVLICVISEGQRSIFDVINSRGRLCRDSIWAGRFSQHPHVYVYIRLGVHPAPSPHCFGKNE